MLNKDFIVPIVQKTDDEKENNNFEIKVDEFTGSTIKGISSENKNEIIMILEMLYKHIYLNSTLPDVSFYQNVVDFALLELDIAEIQDIVEIILEIYILITNFYDFFISYLQKTKLCDKFEIQTTIFSYPKIKNIIENKKQILKLANKTFKSKNTTERMKTISLCILIQEKRESENINQEDYTEYLTTDLLFFIYFLFNIKDMEILKIWISFNKKEFIDADIIYIQKFEWFFFITKAICDAEYVVKKNLVISNKSHKLLNAFFAEFRESSEFKSVIMESFDEQKVEYTIPLFNKYFHVDNSAAEKCLKHLIIQTKTKKLANIFFERCSNIDSDFVEVCVINSKDIENLKDEHMLKISISHYFSLLTRDLDMFSRCIRIIENLRPDLRDKFDPNLCAKYLFDDNIKLCEKSLKKVAMYLERFPESRNIIFRYFIPILDSLKKRFVNIDYDISSICTSKTDISKIQVMPQKIFSDEFIDIFYLIIFYFRQELDLKKYIHILVRLNFTSFVSKCIFGNIQRLDEFFVLSMNEIFKLLEHIPERDYFINEFVNHKKTSFSKNNFISIMLFKKLQHHEISDHIYFLEILDNMINKDMIHLKIDCDYENDKLIIGPELKKDLFLLENFYDDKMIIERMIKELKNESKPETPILIGIMLKLLDTNNQFSEGLIFNSSKIVIKRELNKFCFYAIFYQYNSDGKQSLFKLKGDGFQCEISLHNGRLVKIMNNDGKIDNFLLKDDFYFNRKLSIGLKYSNLKLNLYINETKHTMNTKKCNRIIIGDHFKGIVSRILWYENDVYDKKYLSLNSRSEYFTKYLYDLEKIMTFRNQKGVYIDNLHPYYFSPGLDLKMKNIFTNENILWIENEELIDAIASEIDNKPEIKTMFENSISKMGLKK